MVGTGNVRTTITYILDIPLGIDGVKGSSSIWTSPISVGYLCSFWSGVSFRYYILDNSYLIYQLLDQYIDIATTIYIAVYYPSLTNSIMGQVSLMKIFWYWTYKSER